MKSRSITPTSNAKTLWKFPKRKVFYQRNGNDENGNVSLHISGILPQVNMSQVSKK